MLSSRPTVTRASCTSPVQGRQRAKRCSQARPRDETERGSLGARRVQGRPPWEEDSSCAVALDYRNLLEGPNGTAASGVHALMLEPVGEAEVPTASASSTFEEFFRSTYGRLTGALLLLTGDAGEAEDLAQEALVRVFERWERVRMMDSPEGYVYRTARNLSRRRARRAALRDRLVFWTRAPETDPAVLVEPRQEVLRVLGTLTREQREALVLVEWLGLATEEAGRLLGIDAASVRGRLHRARAAVRAARRT